MVVGSVLKGSGMRDISDMGYFWLGNKGVIGYFVGVREFMFWVGILVDYLG